VIRLLNKDWQWKLLLKASCESSIQNRPDPDAWASARRALESLAISNAQVLPLLARAWYGEAEALWRGGDSKAARRPIWKAIDLYEFLALVDTDIAEEWADASALWGNIAAEEDLIGGLAAYAGAVDRYSSLRAPSEDAMIAFGLVLTQYAELIDNPDLSEGYLITMDRRSLADVVRDRRECLETAALLLERQGKIAEADRLNRLLS